MIIFRSAAPELQNLCARWNLPRDDVDRVLAVCDVNHDGSISFTEFAEHFGGTRSGMMSEAAASQGLHARLARVIIVLFSILYN